jgi:hypothetical protein
MSKYDLNDPRNPNSPYNMWNRESPFYDPEKARNQGNVSQGDVTIILGFLMILFICLGVFRIGLESLCEKVGFIPGFLLLGGFFLVMLLSINYLERRGRKKP